MSDFDTALLAAKSNLAALRVVHALQVLINLTTKEFDPDQPRIPEGEPGAGQWTSGDGSADASILEDLLRMPAIGSDDGAFHDVADKSKRRQISCCRVERKLAKERRESVQTYVP